MPGTNTTLIGDLCKLRREKFYDNRHRRHTSKPSKLERPCWYMMMTFNTLVNFHYTIKLHQNGATTISIMTFSMKGLLVTLSINWIECHYAECRNLFIVMLIVITLNVVLLNVVAPIKMATWTLVNVDKG